MYHDEEEIEELLFDYLSDLFQTFNPQHMEEVIDLVQSRISQSMGNILSHPFTIEEVKDALFQMHPTKVPRVDGIQASFAKDLGI